GTTVAGEFSNSLIWSEGMPASQTRATINLSEPLLAQDGSVALDANSAIIVEVDEIDSSGLAILKAIALSYQDSQGRFKQELLPPSALIIRAEDNQALMAEKTEDTGGTTLGQDVLIGALGAGERGFEVINEPTDSTVISNDDFFRSTTNREDSSLLNGAAEGAFSTTKERLEQRSEQILEEQSQRTPIYQIEADTPVSVIVNSFLKVQK
ncbi:MAG: hypothetical protein ACRC1Z_10340, partial [Waterburya sp.]